MNLDFSTLAGAQDFLWQGFKYSLTLTVSSMVFGIFFGTLLAMARMSSIKPLSLAAAGYVNLFRSVPLVLVIFWFYILVPLLTGVDVGAERSAFLTFAIFEAAYYCEIIRAGIQSIPRGQIAAGQAMGFSYGQNMRYVILPQAFRNVVPLLLTQTIVLFQDTSLVYVVGATDLLGAADKVAHRDNTLVEMYMLVALIYFSISFALSQAVKRLHARIAIVR
ncbi:amino acid ABC transporter permease [Rivihabitans pingtungensis]|jgi:glutamate/aspartate transport system permease protein|uniref:Glutamate/aspartate import permease protein GltK n=1 Tax=Rivihabitans pingtungensis TaxID=1054498 RepID=A0A318KEU0_9NEIS|nr:amino acid ABC transporter permease [Rivihabitans pingtungensis]MCK6436588.1 amino acid ABC transporter permease [Rivihabitans pingtungensis]PXX75095.1 glutamate/aspartate transport system permease protein [Rivihabitans pingtungensis]HNX71651.1 amino acid ABC transporter permease [Rivihabitans pingtungensis]